METKPDMAFVQAQMNAAHPEIETHVTGEGILRVTGCGCYIKNKNYGVGAHFQGTMHRITTVADVAPIIEQIAALYKAPARRGTPSASVAPITPPPATPTPVAPDVASEKAKFEKMQADLMAQAQKLAEVEEAAITPKVASMDDDEVAEIIERHVKAAVAEILAL